VPTHFGKGISIQIESLAKSNIWAQRGGTGKRSTAQRVRQRFVFHFGSGSDRWCRDAGTLEIGSCERGDGMGNIRGQLSERFLDLLVRSGLSDKVEPQSMHTNLNWVVVCFAFVDTGDPTKVQLVEQDTRARCRSRLETHLRRLRWVCRRASTLVSKSLYSDNCSGQPPQQ
jgi:hypothetical protein